MKPPLSMDGLIGEAERFAAAQSRRKEPSLYGVTDGKAVGTHLERRFSEHLSIHYSYAPGSAASGLDFPELKVDLKVTSVKQPQSSCPFRSARQKIFGLGYSLLIFVYDKTDDEATSAARLDIRHALFVDKDSTADYQTTRGLLDILDRDGNTDDLTGFLLERHLPVDDIGARALAEEVLRNPPRPGALTVSNALQWRLQYGRAIAQADELDGVVRIR